MELVLRMYRTWKRFIWDRVAVAFRGVVFGRHEVPRLRPFGPSLGMTLSCLFI